jgi:transposase-like protein
MVCGVRLNTALSDLNRIRCHLAGISLREVSNYLEMFGIKRSHVAIHTWVNKADLDYS